MKDFAHYLDAQAVLFLQTTQRDEALGQLVARLNELGKLDDAHAFYEALLAREKIVSTGIGMGVAIPHAKLPGYKNFFMAIGIQKSQGIPWNSLDATPVRLIFLIGGPDQQQTEYLQLLSCVTSALKSSERRKKLLLVNSGEELLALLQG